MKHMAQEAEVNENQNGKKKRKIDYSKFRIEDFDFPPHFPNFVIPTKKCMQRPMISREEWGAELPREIVPLKLPVNRVLFTHTGTEECLTKEHCLAIVKRLQVEHMNERGLADIQYNFLAGSDLNVYEGRGWAAKPEKNEKFPGLSKKSYIEIAYIGNFIDKSPPMEMMQPPWAMLEDSLVEEKVSAKTRITEDYPDHDDWDMEQFINRRTQEGGPSYYGDVDENERMIVLDGSEIFR